MNLKKHLLNESDTSAAIRKVMKTEFSDVATVLERMNKVINDMRASGNPHPISVGETMEYLQMEIEKICKILSKK